MNSTVYLTDLLDIIIIALFLYSALLLLKRARTYMVFLGMAFTLGLFVIAKMFNLYLTSLVLQYLIGVSVILFVIIFQTEIRKYFEFLGLVGTRRISMTRTTKTLPSIDEIIQSCVKMARNKIGALIIIQGNDDLDSLIEGGIVLDGVISEEVILSIFDPTSEGHDGAMLIKNNRINKFGTHLPLSNNFKEIGKRGTRHSAALGLSEVSDSLAIVVSEEKGVISLCREGKMKTLSDYAVLEKELEKYIRVKFVKNRRNAFTNLIRHNFSLKTASVVLSGLIWFFSVYQSGIMEKSFQVPVSFQNVPKDMVIESYKPENITVVLKGRGDKMLSKVNGSDIKIETDVSDIQDGVNRKYLSGTNLPLPNGITVSSIEPDSCLLTARRYSVVTVPVSVVTEGKLPKGFEIKNITVNTETVELSIPSGVTLPPVINTETIDVTDKTGSIIVPSKLKVPDGIKLLKSDGTVEVALTIEKADIDRKSGY